MSWRNNAALRCSGSTVFHLSEGITDDVLVEHTLCGKWVSSKAGNETSSIREARAKGLRLCKKCAARKDELFARLLEVDSEAGPDGR